MDTIETAIDLLHEAVSELRSASHAPSVALRSWSVSKANAAMMRAQDAVDKIQSDNIEALEK